METSIEQILVTFHSRKLLVYPSLNQSSASIEPSSAKDSFDAKIVMVLSVLLCGLICSLCLNSIIRCAMRRSRFTSVVDDHSINGNNSTAGITKKALKTFPVVDYSGDLKIPGLELETECVICLTEFSPGDKIKILPKCNHGFHIKCIDKWLHCHSSCPTCRHCLIETCQKIVGCTAPPQPPSNASEIILIRIAPLEPEGMVPIVLASVI